MFWTALVVAITSIGCGHLVQARDSVEPFAVHSMVAEQTLNPEAGHNRKVVAGLDGTASANVAKGYTDSFKPQEGESTSGFQGLEDLSSN
jgi:hypothetical protein